MYAPFFVLQLGIGMWVSLVGVYSDIGRPSPAAGN